MGKMTRVPSVPLITNDPYFSIWSPADHLYDTETESWTGAKKPIRGNITIDGEVYRFLGTGEEKTLEQVGLNITPTQTIYQFEHPVVSLEVVFTSPLILYDLELVSRPVTYIDVSVSSKDGAEHDVEVNFEFDERICHDAQTREKMFGATERESITPYAWMGKSKQTPLGHSGDHIDIDWGYLYVASEQNDVVHSEYVQATDDHDAFIKSSLRFGTVNGTGKHAFLSVAYDDVVSIMYFGQPTKAFWAKDGRTIFDVLEDSIAEHGQILEKCYVFDQQLVEQAFERGGEAYQLIASLAYRQTIAAHKLILDENDEVIFLSKECDSNGCIGTVDVSYPSIPLYLMYNPELVKGMMRPIFKFASLPVWPYDFAPHDVGRYPYATGQVYGLDHKEGNGTGLGHGDVPPMFYQYRKEQNPYGLRNQMPVEECGNMLIMAAAVTKLEKDASFAAENIGLLEKWVSYLLKYGQDPGEQLCTDDFAGHLSHNVNLSAKAIVGIASYAYILKELGREGEAKLYLQQARKMAKKWEADAEAEGRTRLTFDNEDGWSLKYNLVWDVLLGTELFSKEMIAREIKWYVKVTNEFGTPLDSRKDYTKSDWILWCASLADNKEDFEALIQPIHQFLQKSDSRVAFSDWYDTKTGSFMHFKNRTVQGGLYMPLLRDMLT
nr:DUF4965 domain-containing protein [Paenibacillus bovis]